MTEKNIQTVEIKGVKFDVDLSTAVKIENYQVGDRVKVLYKMYGDEWKTANGIIIGFHWFEDLPTIHVAYVPEGYDEYELKLLNYNKRTKDYQLSKITEGEHLFIKRFNIERCFDRKIGEKKQEIEELQQKKAFFLEHFGSRVSEKGE